MGFLTSSQTEVWNLHVAGMKVSEIARKLDRDESSIRERLRLARLKMEREIDPAVKGAMDKMGITTVPRQVWFKDDTLSIQVRIDDVDEEALTFADTLSAVLSSLPSAMVMPKPRKSIADLMAVYPIFDLHVGLRAHQEISGANMDLQTAKSDILTAMAEVMHNTPNARRGVIINGGDFTHQTDDSNMTRRSGHILDVAGRNAPTVQVALEILCTLIEMALRKHEVVEYYSVPGNHDPQNWETIQFALRERYRNNKRVKIDVRWDEFSMIEHGEVALFIHHGDKRKPKDLAFYCAAAFQELWGRSKFRMLLTGHLHHLKEEEYPGIIWRQFASPSVRDHYSASHAYLSKRLISSMVFDLRSKKFDYTAEL